MSNPSNPPPRRVRLAQVARVAGVSVSTASRALNNYADITEATRAKVLAVAEQLGYRAHGTARSLRVGDVRMVAAVVDPESLHPTPGRLSNFWAIILAELTAQLSERGYGLLILMHGQANELLKQMPYDAALVLTTRIDVADVIDAIPFGVALVTATGQTEPERRHISLGHDYTGAAHAVFDHLREAGAKRPALIAPDINHTFSRGLAAGVDAWTAQSGIEVVRIGFIPDAVEPALEAAFDQDCDAVFVVGADSGMLLTTLQRLGREPGRDLLVVAQSDSPADEFLSPSMTALAFDPKGTAQAIAEALDAALRGGTGQMEVGFTLRVGDSTQPAKKPAAAKRRRPAKRPTPGSSS